jgi:hypothetical protein
VAYQLLDAFQSLFAGKEYRHRRSNLGDSVASHFYTDLFKLGRSQKYRSAVTSKTHVINTANVTVGKTARRGDGTFGEKVPSVLASNSPGHDVAFGSVATIEIGIEVKILAKAMIKQLDRVGTDILNQISEFKRHGGNPICIGIVGLNFASTCTSYEGTRSYTTDGKTMAHPIDEAPQAERRLTARISPVLDELIVLRFVATNSPPFAFRWLNATQTEAEYAASLVRVSREYEVRF